MPTPLLATKLYIPSRRSGVVPRPRLIERLHEGLAPGCKLTLISAPAGFGKSTLVSEWISSCGKPVSWLSLDEADNDPARFLSYLIASLQTIQAGMGEGMLAALQSPEPPSVEVILTNLLNEIAIFSEDFLLVLDDYHAIDSRTVDQLMTFFIEHQPPQMHLVISTREDPSLPLARLRVRHQCTELRAADLRFTPAESAEFLNRVMGLNLTEKEITALEARTEGWIAGLQMAALSMQGLEEPTVFIQSFTGSHRFVLDYLLEEVLQRQPAEVQTFLLRTSLLERMCGPLCDAVMGTSTGVGEKTLISMERANLFIIPLDHERHWYRYHHLFGDLLRKRLGQSLSPAEIAELHIRASEWYENNDLMLEAFRHAAAAEDIERAVRLMESRKMPLHRRGTATTILSWLESLPKSLLDARPGLWWKQAALLLVIGEPKGVEEKLQAIEAALNASTVPGAALDETTRDLIGKIACAWANLAQMKVKAEPILIHGQRALEFLHPDNLSDRSVATRSMGFAYYLLEDLDEAGLAYAEAYSLAQAAGDPINSTLASIRIGQIQEEKNQLHQAAETYRQVMDLVSEYSPSNATVAYLGLARIHYEWNDLVTAEQLGEQSFRLAQQYDQVVDRLILSEIFLARLRLARGDASGAERILSQAEQTAHQKGYIFRTLIIAHDQALVYLRQGNIGAALSLATQYDLPVMKARVHIAQDEPAKALAILEPVRQEAQARGWPTRLLLVRLLQSTALLAHGEKEKALELLGEVLAQTESEGFIRHFVDEGALMAELLFAAAAQGIRPGYVNKLLAAFAAEPKGQPPTASVTNGWSMIEPLSPREQEILGLIAQGLSNQEICQRLFLALDTIKGHNRRIFEKLQVQRRTEAIARARELGLL